MLVFFALGFSSILQSAELKKTITFPAKDEKDLWFAIFAAVSSKEKVSYIPATRGNHGSRALWKKYQDSGGYWKAVKDFLDKNFKK